jgi:hypothetical protein
MDSERWGSLVKQLYSTVDELGQLAKEQGYKDRPFTLDGHIVGTMGECLVAAAYGLELEEPSNKGYDATYNKSVKVEIKTTQGKRVAFRWHDEPPERVIIVKLNQDGTFEEHYNGPGCIIWKQYTGKPPPPNGQFQMSLSRVGTLTARVPVGSRIPRKTESDQGKV